MAHDVFISYSAKDKPTADAVCATLEANRIRCWIAPRDVLPGVRWVEAIVDGINESRIMVLVFSSSSNNSDQVMSEVQAAVSNGIPIIPLRIEDVPLTRFMQFYIGSRHWLDALTPPLERHLQQLAKTVKLLLSRERPEEGLPDEAPAAEKPYKPTPLRNAFEIARRWGSRPAVRLAAVLAAVAGAVVGIAIFVLVGLLSDGGGDSGLVGPVPTLDEGSPTVTMVQPTPVQTPGPSPAHTGEVVTNVTAKGFGAPGRSTRGIAWDGTHLWVADAAELFKVDTSGEVVGAYSPPEVTPEGLTWDGATFWIFTTNYSEIYQFSIDESGGVPETRVISSFRSPNQRIGGTNDGLAWDGAGLWYSDSYNLYRLDTAGNVLTSLAFGHEIAGLAWDGERLWLAYNSFPENATFVKTDTDGNTLLTFSGPLYHIDALTWGDGHLWAAGTDSHGGQQMIYNIDVETTVIGLQE